MAQNNWILYRGRYIRHLTGKPWEAHTYCLTWAKDGGSERLVVTQPLKDLLNRIDDTIAFFGKWEFLA